MSKAQVPSNGVYTISHVSVTDNVAGVINYGSGCYPVRYLDAPAASYPPHNPVTILP